MAIDHRIGGKVIKAARREEAAGTRVDPYPYIGIVKNNLDPTRSGRMQVYIPDLGGPPDEPNNWRTVSYASPFQGYTPVTKDSVTKPSTANRFESVHHTYGMWMVPPDIGVQVIVLFVGGDPLRGYWIACVNPHLSHYMLPALGGTPNVDPETLSASDRKAYLTGNVNIPTVEFNEYTKDFTNEAYYNNNKPAHKIQFEILKVQGLSQDPVRGSISSSSQRESPSHVFGISTPGRPIDDPADDRDNYLSALASGSIDPKYLFTKSRKGGHQFVMDDGAALGEDQLVRLRTAGGHQILLHDTDSTIYIGHATGNSWVELTRDGSINVFSAGDFSLRAEGSINLQADTDLNIDVGGDININNAGKFSLNSNSTELLQQADFKVEAKGATTFKVGGELLVDATGRISLKSGGIFAVEGTGIYQNSGKTSSVPGLKELIKNQLPDTTGIGDSWSIVEGALKTVVTVAPTHEPYYRGETGVFFKPTSPGIQPGTAWAEAVDATKNAQDTGVQNPAGDKDLRNQPACNCTIGNLSSDQLTAYFAQIGKSESGGNYAAVNSIGYVGKYQFGYPALIDGGYVKSSCKSNSQLQNPNNWTGKNGITSLDAWLANPVEQESAMCAYTQRNYTSMCKIGAVTQEQSPEDVAGMLAVSHLLGPGGAKQYRQGQNSADAYGTTGATYFNKGKYAVAQLAPKVPAVNAG